MDAKAVGSTSVVRKVWRLHPMPSWLCDAQYFASLHSGMPSHMPLDMRVFLWQGLSADLQQYINKIYCEDDHHSWNIACRNNYQMY